MIRRYLDKIFYGLLLLAGTGMLHACGTAGDADERPAVVVTTMMLEDIVNNIAEDRFSVHAMMGPGVDPHVYRATPNDVRRLDRADLIIYNGHFLEARLAEVLAKIPDRTFAAAEQLDESRLIQAFEFGGNYDPHVWFDVSLWAEVAAHVGERLIAFAPEHEEQFRSNMEAYIAELNELHEWVGEQISTIPEEKRILITAHDAFAYFGRAYNIEVEGLQGLSTQSEVGLQDITRMVRLIMDRNVPAIFLETSVPPRSVQSLINGVSERGGQVRIGGELFSDAMGERGTPEGTYAGMVRHNVTIIVEALK
ncbi:MAG: zinc ABC transporter substrate-binding protein [Balneolales bacterium]|nr:zinc ABC transporter substrate-binding protein [Balneolales bacterium]